MRFGVPPAPRRGAQDRAIVPMINVVFLLLVFVLMTASLAPPDPFPVAPPTAEVGEPEVEGGTLHVGADGRMAFAGAEGEAVWDALALHDGPLILRADAALPAADLARVLPRLAGTGLSEVRIVTVRP